MNVDTQTRRYPKRAWSSGRAIIRWPNRIIKTEATVAAFYTDRNELLADHKRAAERQRMPGVGAQTHSLRLEKTPEDQAWIDFGTRYYPSRNQVTYQSTNNAFEMPEHRIAIPVMVGGKNRMQAIKLVRSVHELWFLFVLYDTNDPNENLDKQWDRLLRGYLGPSLGTRPIPLAGIFTLGTMAFVAPNQQCRDSQSYRESQVAVPNARHS